MSIVQADWKRVFLVLPRIINGKIRWLRFAYRRRIHFGDADYLPAYYDRYAENIFEVLKG